MLQEYYASAESYPGEKWRMDFQRLWPFYQRWFFSRGDIERPSYLECVRNLRMHMPELMSVYRHLCEMADGSDAAARFLSMYCPVPYVSACTQAVWTGEEPILVRNYDYHSALLERRLMLTKWHEQKVMAMSDGMWGVLDGINESGLAVSLSFGGRLNVGVGFGIPIILRYILEFCCNTKEAIEVLKRVPCHMSYNVTVVDASQNFSTVFLAPDRDVVVRPLPVATNHQQQVEWERHAWATATVERQMKVLGILADPEATSDILINQFLYPPIYNAQHYRGIGTLYTAVYRPFSASATFLWPYDSWHQSIEHFHEGLKQVYV